MRIFAVFGVMLLSVSSAFAQQATRYPEEQRVPLAESAVAVDADGAASLEGSLLTTALSGAPETPLANIQIVMKNVSTYFYNFISVLVTFYDASGVRCGEGIFKADVLAENESFETDAPGIRIRCSPTNWRIVATNLVPRTLPGVITLTESAQPTVAPTKLLISVDGEEHPLQLEKPMVLMLGDRQRRIIVRQAP
jgi:hypothetical protein